MLGSGLIAIGALMLFGLLRSDISFATRAAVGSLVIGVALPMGSGIAVLRHARAVRARRAQREAQLREQMIEADILRLAAILAGRLSVSEVEETLGLATEAVKNCLDSLVARNVACIEVSDEGTLVYSFRLVRHAAARQSLTASVDD
jgi:hypothetical protein